MKRSKIPRPNPSRSQIIVNVGNSKIGNIFTWILLASTGIILMIAVYLEIFR